MDLLDPLKRFIVVRRVPDLSILTHDHPLGSGTSHPHSGMNVLGVVAGRLTRQPPFPIAECRTIVSVTVPRATGNPIKSYLKIDRSSKNHFAEIPDRLILNSCRNLRCRSGGLRMSRIIRC